MAKGLGHGFLIGAGIVASIFGYDIITNPKGYDCQDGVSLCLTKGEGMTIGIVLFGVPMGFLGMLYGAATKTTETYNFDDKETMEK